MLFHFNRENGIVSVSKDSVCVRYRGVMLTVQRGSYSIRVDEGVPLGRNNEELENNGFWMFDYRTKDIRAFTLHWPSRRVAVLVNKPVMRCEFTLRFLDERGEQIAAFELDAHELSVMGELATGGGFIATLNKITCAKGTSILRTSCEGDIHRIVGDDL